jgi:hypothetical protein
LPDSVSDSAPDLNALVEKAKRGAETWLDTYAESPGDELPPTMLVANANYPHGLVVPLPGIQSDKQKAALACIWVPALLHHVEAHAAVISQAAWSAPLGENITMQLRRPRPSSRRDRESCVIIAGAHRNGLTRADTAQVARVAGKQELGEWLTGTQAAGLWSGGLLAGVGACSESHVESTLSKGPGALLSYQFTSDQPRYEALQRFYARETDYAVALGAVDPLNLTGWFFTRADAAVLGKACAGLGYRRKLTVGEKASVLLSAWVEQPLLDLGYTMHDLQQGVLSAEDTELLELARALLSVNPGGA